MSLFPVGDEVPMGIVSPQVKFEVQNYFTNSEIFRESDGLRWESRGVPRMGSSLMIGKINGLSSAVKASRRDSA
jgi:hypothetical protein